MDRLYDEYTGQLNIMTLNGKIETKMHKVDKQSFDNFRSFNMNSFHVYIIINIDIYEYLLKKRIS